MKVAWDEVKNRVNQQKHGVSFEEAKELFVSGVDYLEIFDDAHSDFEDRFIAIGPIERGVVLAGADITTARASDLGAPSSAPHARPV